MFSFGTFDLIPGNKWVLPTLNKNNKSHQFIIANLKCAIVIPKMEDPHSFSMAFNFSDP